MATRQSAILFGATGLTGGLLLRELLDRPDYSSMTSVVRRDSEIKQAKLKPLHADHRSTADIISLGFEQIQLFRPSFPTGKRGEARAIESWGNSLFKCFNALLICVLSKYKSVLAFWLTRAFARVGTNGSSGIHRYYWASF